MAATINSPSCVSKALVYLGTGTYSTEIQYLEIKFYDISLYVEESFNDYLHDWIGGTKDDLLAEGSGFSKTLSDAQIEKIVMFDIIKEVKGTQFVKPLQNYVRDKLAAIDEFEEEEEDGLEKLVDYFQRERPWLSKHTSIYLHWPTPKNVNIYVVDCGDSPTSELVNLFEKGKYHAVSNEKIAHNILDWTLVQSSFSPPLKDSIASTFESMKSNVA